MSTFKLPELGEGLSEGEIVSWKIKEGDVIKADTPLVEVMTDKATVEVPAPKTGKVTKLYYKPGQMAKVGQPLVDIDVEGAAVANEAPVAAAKPAANVQSTPVAVQTLPRANQADDSRILASPAVRKMAREMHVDLTQVHGSGERGRVLRDDLLTVTTTTTQTTVVSRASAVDSLEERIPFIGIRRKISDRLTESYTKAVHFTHFDECDFTEVMRLREELNAAAALTKNPVKLTFLPFFIKASIAALKKFPILNSSLDEARGEVVIKHYYHYGISVQTDNGLMVGVVRDCDQKNIFELAAEIKAVADRARSGKASMQDLNGSTITITNPGNIGGLYATPIINYPESVILGMYQIKKRPIVKTVNGEDQIVARPMMYTNITCDHRIVDGAIAAGYLKLFCDYIESPAKIAFL